MKVPELFIKNDNIYIFGHFDDIVKCAKLDFLCRMYDAFLCDGCAVIPYTEEFLNKLQLIDCRVSFSGCDDGSCTTSCSGGCYGCGADCSRGCSLDCGDCGDECGSGCKNTCSTCSDDCSSGCSGGCNSCQYYDPCGSCDTTCNLNCSNCGGGCNQNCDDGCTGQSVSPVYEYVNNLISTLNTNKKILSADISNIESLVRNEVQRRSLSIHTNPSEPVGTLINSSEVNKMLTDLTQMSKTFQPIIAGESTLASKIVDYSKAATELYKIIVNPGRN